VSASLNDLRRVFEAATTNADKVSFTMTSLPNTQEALSAILSIARAAGLRSGAALRRVELSSSALKFFGSSFHEVPLVHAEGGGILRLVFEREGVALDDAA
jgi:hypothetical protein